MCGVPFCIAPELFGKLESDNGESLDHCFVRQQPQTPDQVADMLQAIGMADTRCIRYKGTDYSIQSALVHIGDADQCDVLPIDLREETELLAGWWEEEAERVLREVAEQSTNEN